MVQDDFKIFADLNYTIAEGTTMYSDVVGGAPYSLASFSNVEVAETSLSLDLVKRVKDWEIGLRSYLGIFNDKISPGFLDGEVFTTTFAIKRYF